MKIKLLLHAGRHKTGTSSLQLTLTKNFDKLLEYGILYPKTGRQAFAHHEFAILMRKKNIKSNTEKIQKLIDQLILEITNQRKNISIVLLSSEAFQNVLPTDIEKYFSLFKIQPIFYVRNKY